MFLLEIFAFLCGVIIFGIAAKRGFGLVSKVISKPKSTTKAINKLTKKPRI